MEKHRFSGYSKTLDDFRDKILIKCPNCLKKSILIKIDRNTQKVICENCGFNKIINSFLFDYELWLTTSFEGKSLSAFNHEHLDFLINFIKAELRKRNLNDIRNKSIGSRLPKWMTSKNNRTKVLKLLQSLQEK